MEQANLTVTIVFNDGAPNASLNIYDENFSFEYATQERMDENKLIADIRINSAEGIDTAQNFLTTYVHHIVKPNNLKEITIDTFRPSLNNQHKSFNFKENEFKNFSCGYRNLSYTPHYVDITFDII